MRLTALLCAATMMLVAVACSPTTEEAEMDLCTALGAFGTAVAGLEAIGPTSTVEDYQAAVTALDDSMADVRTAAGEVEAARADELQAAADTFKSTVGDIPDDATLAGASAQIMGAGATLRETYDSIYSSLGCPAAGG